MLRDKRAKNGKYKYDISRVYSHVCTVTSYPSCIYSLMFCNILTLCITAHKYATCVAFVCFMLLLSPL